jgi:hypothetical protein
MFNKKAAANRIAARRVHFFHISHNPQPALSMPPDRREHTSFYTHWEAEDRQRCVKIEAKRRSGKIWFDFPKQFR